MENRQSLIASLAGGVCARRYGAARAETINQLATEEEGERRRCCRARSWKDETSAGLKRLLNSSTIFNQGEQLLQDSEDVGEDGVKLILDVPTRRL